MADVNMTVSAVTARGGKSRMRSVTFTHTAVGTAAGNATTPFQISGRLLKYIRVGGDAEWQFTLNDGIANIFSSGNLDATTTESLLSMHATIPHRGIPMAGQTLLCTTANVSSAGGGTAPAIKVFWEESAECNAVI